MRTSLALASARDGPGTSRTKLALLIVAVTILWGANWPAMKLAVSEFEPWTFRLVSVVGAGLTLLVLAGLAGEPIMLERRLVLPHLAISFFGVTLWHMLTAYGLLWVGGGRAAIIAFTMPIWATLLSIVFFAGAANGAARCRARARHDRSSRAHRARSGPCLSLIHISEPTRPY